VANESVRELYKSLRKDEARVASGFSSDMTKAHEVILDVWATDAERARALRAWLKRNQPCIFGRIAAQMDRLHVCVLSETDLLEPDAFIKEKIQSSRIWWKQRAFRYEFPEHGFVLLAASKKLSEAAADDNLHRLVLRLRELHGCPVVPDLNDNDIVWETLYLEHPETKTCYRFKFSLDYFGAQGDGKWWHDHRVPGGVAFTANSVGHMVRGREWYEKKGPQVVWALLRSMDTVEEAASTAWGKAIQLLPLKGEPFHGGPCPFANPNDLKPSLKGKDWSCYSGILSTDHSIRKEFFQPSTAKPEDLPKWNMDLTYLYQESNAAFPQFLGEPVSCEEVQSEIGDPGDRRILAESVMKRDRPAEHEDRITRLLGALEAEWTLDEAELSEMNA